MALTDYVIMPSADYVAACDKVRERTGKTDPIKSGDLAAEIEGIPAGGGGSMEGFHMVRFFNDDRTTLLYAAYVPTNGSVIYAGNTPVSAVDDTLLFYGFVPAPVNVTADLDCYAYYDTEVGTLDETSWFVISTLSERGEAENYFAVGDTKMIHVEGTVGTLEVNGDYGVYIIGFDHNKELEGNGIHFGTFKTAASQGIDICLVDSKANSSVSDGTKYFNINHLGSYIYGGWAGCDMRYDILGSTDNPPSGYGAKPDADRVGYDPSPTCASNPVANTLMAALPADLRAVMKPMIKYTDCKGDKTDNEENVVATVDYLPFLAEYEVHGVRRYANQFEQNKQRQYGYYAAGKSKLKKTHSSPNASVNGQWWLRSVHSSHGSAFCRVNNMGDLNFNMTNYSNGLAPIFKV